MLWLADLVLALHVAYVAFVVLGQTAILLGLACGAAWARNPCFRWLHLAAILVVAAEALLGIECPLTSWERNLRQTAGLHGFDLSFTARLLRGAIFVQAPEWVLAVLHVAFAGVVALTFLLAPPRRLGRSAGSAGD
jgi:hypothetical protein